jgi:2-enoate reductase
MFCFIKVKMPYLCGLWRFANTYFIERAKGGTGILYMGCQMLNEQIAQGSMEGYLDTYTVLPSLTSVCDGCHRYGAKIVCQISTKRIS